MVWSWLRNRCPACKGRKNVRLPPDGRKVTCPYCHGTGRKPFLKKAK